MRLIDNHYAAPQTDPGNPELPQPATSSRVPRWLRFLILAWLVQCAFALALYLVFVLIP
jgi:hypothetical protein